MLKIQEALENVRKLRWTIWKAADSCGLSYREFLPLLRKENIPFPLSYNEMVQELNELSSE